MDVVKVSGVDGVPAGALVRHPLGQGASPLILQEVVAAEVLPVARVEAQLELGQRIRELDGLEILQRDRQHSTLGGAGGRLEAAGHHHLPILGGAVFFDTAVPLECHLNRFQFARDSK